MNTATVSQKGWIVIPKNLRERYHLKPGTKVSVMDYGGVVSLVPLSDNPIKTLRGMFAGEPLTEMLLEERRAEREHEEKRYEALHSG